MLADPDISVESENEVYTTWQTDKVGFEPTNEIWLDCDKLSVTKLMARCMKVMSADLCLGYGTLPYLSERVCKDIVPSEKKA